MEWTHPILIFVVPILFIIEVSHWIFRKNHIEKLSMLGACLGALWGVILMIILISGTTGESGLAAIALAPFFLFVFIALGLGIGICYATLQRTFLSNKFRNIRIVFFLFIMNFVFCSYFYFLGPYRGKVVDTNTGDPVEGALVLVGLDTESIYSGDSSASYAEHTHTFTDEEGAFKISKFVFVFRPLTIWKIPEVRIFKPGYENSWRYSVRGKDRDFTIRRWRLNTIKLQKLNTIKEIKLNHMRMDYSSEARGKERMNYLLIKEIEEMKFSFHPSYRPNPELLDEYERILESGTLDGDKSQEYSKYELELWKQFGIGSEKYRKKKPKPVVISDPFKDCTRIRLTPDEHVIKIGQELGYSKYDCSEETKRKNRQQTEKGSSE